jgi:aminobenzoyl-glutamate utilization protein B
MVQLILAHYTSADSPDEREFAEELQKGVASTTKVPGPENVFTDESEGHFPASGDVGDVSGVVPTAQLMAATYAPGVTSHSWQAAACVGSTVGHKGMLVAARTIALATVELFQNPAQV